MKITKKNYKEFKEKFVVGKISRVISQDLVMLQPVSYSSQYYRFVLVEDFNTLNAYSGGGETYESLFKIFLKEGEFHGFDNYKEALQWLLEQK